MAKLKFGHLKWVSNPTATRFEFADPKLDEPIEIWLRPLSSIEEEAALELGERLAAKYVRGGWVDAHGTYAKDPLTALVDGQPVKLNARALYVMARIEVMQSPPNPEDRYLADMDLIEMACLLPDVWNQVIQATGRIAVEEANPKASA